MSYTEVVREINFPDVDNNLHKNQILSEKYKPALFVDNFNFEIQNKDGVLIINNVDYYNLHLETIGSLASILKQYFCEVEYDFNLHMLPAILLANFNNVSVIKTSDFIKMPEYLYHKIPSWHKKEIYKFKDTSFEVSPPEIYDNRRLRFVTDEIQPHGYQGTDYFSLDENIGYDFIYEIKLTSFILNYSCNHIISTSDYYKYVDKLPSLLNIITKMNYEELNYV